MDRKLVYAVVAVVVVIVLFYIITYFNVENSLCTISKKDNSAYKNYLAVDKCVLNGQIVYYKRESTENVQDSQTNIFYNQTGQEICAFHYWGTCDEKLKEWNPDFNIEKCEWMEICSKSGL